MSTLRALNGEIVNATECAMRSTHRGFHLAFSACEFGVAGSAPGGAAIAAMRTACLVSYRIRYLVTVISSSKRKAFRLASPVAPGVIAAKTYTT